MTLKTATRFRGDTVPFTRTLVVGQTTTPVNLTGATAVLTLSDQRSGGTKQGPITGTITNATGGVVNFNLPTTLAVGEYYWDVQVTLPTGIETVEVGVLTVDQDITV